MLQNKRYVYRYLLIDDSSEREIPLSRCPDCSNDFEKPCSVKILLDDKLAKYEPEVLSKLECGILQDTADMEVANGKMINLLCAKCDISITDHDSVDEEEFRF